MATGYSSAWSKSGGSMGYFYLRCWYETTYNSATNTSTVRVVPQIKNSVGTIGQCWVYNRNSNSDAGVWGNGTRLYTLSGNYGGSNNNLVQSSVTTDYKDMSTLSGSISTFTIQHNNSGSASFNVGVCGTIRSNYYNNYLDGVGGKTSDTITVTQSRTLNVSYNANGGSGAPSATYFYGTTENIVLSSTSPTRTGYTFLGWATSSSASTAAYSPGQNIGTRTSSLVLYAVWAINSYNVNLTAGTDIASVSGGGAHDYNSSVTVTAVLGSVPGYTYAFDGWYDGDTKVSSSQSYTFTMPANAVSLTAKATKTPNDYTLSVNAGDYVASVSGGGTKTFGDSVTVEAVLGSATGYTYSFDGWYNGSTKVSSSLSYTFTYNTADDISLTAKGSRTINSYSLTLAKGDYIASVSGGGTKVYNSSVTAVAVLGSASGYAYAFDGWYNGATKVSSSLSYTFNMPASALALTAKATRSIIPYTLSISAGTGTTISVERTSSPNAGAATGALTAADPVYYGDILSVVFGPNAGYGITSRTINGSAAAASVTYTVTGNTSIAAAAAPLEYTMTLSISNSGVVASVLRLSSPIGGGSVGQIFNGATLYYGDEILISYDVGLGYQVDAHTINGVDFDSGDTYTVVGDTTIVVTASASGFVYINNQPYLVYFGDGANWVRYQAQVGDGSNWIAH